MQISIDPGLGGTGFCVWTRDWQLLEAAIICPPKKYPWDIRGSMIAESITMLKSKYKLNKAYIEMPAFFASVSGTMVAARGDLLKLTWLVGLIYGIFPLGSVRLVPVSHWKGSLPKDVVARRLQAIMKPKDFAKLKSHSIDAAGIALYVKGDLK